MTNGMHQRFEFIHAWRIYPVETQFSMPIFNVYTIEKQHVEMYGAA